MRKWGVKRDDLAVDLSFYCMQANLCMELKGQIQYCCSQLEGLCFAFVSEHSDRGCSSGISTDQVLYQTLNTIPTILLCVNARSILKSIITIGVCHSPMSYLFHNRCQDEELKYSR